MTFVEAKLFCQGPLFFLKFHHKLAETTNFKLEPVFNFGRDIDNKVQITLNQRDSH